MPSLAASLFAALLPFVAQASLGSGAGASLDIPKVDRAPNAVNPRHKGEAYLAADLAPRPKSRLDTCLDDTNTDPEAAEQTARAWLQEEKGSKQAEPQLCLGSAEAAMGNWAEARAAFTAGRAIAATSDKVLKARLAAMAGNAALADGDGAGALALIDTAHAEAKALHAPRLAGGMAIDRARALVALGRNEEAVLSLAEAREALPNDAAAWLLSATLARRMNKLGMAESEIVTAAQLAPTDPAIGLEAGVIAMLAGHEAAARKSWQSAITTAPDSAEAKQARAYLDQLGSAPAAPASAPAPSAAPGRHER
ncbi:MAG TPA: hypothetical protein VFF98_00655 [Novosphingobium sp.]|nr:hypothetical protein [Novosphingobium sp.]HZV10802.1 hypothetical protein [Novosphingobium sp.]